MTNLVKRTYRIAKEHDKKVKKLSSSKRSESQVVRDMIGRHED